MDSRDQGSEERMDVLSIHYGIWNCTFVGECSVVCPKHVDPAGAIHRFRYTLYDGLQLEHLYGLIAIISVLALVAARVLWAFP